MKALPWFAILGAALLCGCPNPHAGIYVLGEHFSVLELGNYGSAKRVTRVSGVDVLGAWGWAGSADQLDGLQKVEVQVEQKGRWVCRYGNPNLVEEVVYRNEKRIYVTFGSILVNGQPVARDRLDDTFLGEAGGMTRVLIAAGAEPKMNFRIMPSGDLQYNDYADRTYVKQKR